MILKVAPLICLLSVGLCQESGVSPDVTTEDLDSVIASDPSSTSATTSSNETQDCKMADGAAGKCTAYYKCPTYSIEEQSGLIDIHLPMSSENDCTSYIDVCCLEKDISSSTVTPSPEPVKREGCGWHNPQGVGFHVSKDSGEEVKFGEFPWICALLQVDANSSEPLKAPHKYIGGGTLIHPSVVLTTAHIVSRGTKNGLLIARAGEWDTQTLKEPYPHQDREVASVAIHQDYNKNTLYYDIAVVFLSSPMVTAPNVGVACLPPPREVSDTGTRCVVTGWGKENFENVGAYQAILKKVELPVVDHRSCLTQLRNTRLGPKFELHSSFMCAGGEDTDACKGDGGAALVCPIQDEPGRYTQRGIVAWGIGCGNAVPNVYVDTSNLRAWVDDKVAGKGYDPRTYTYHI